LDAARANQARLDSPELTAELNGMLQLAASIRGAAADGR
jgi:hypothetical protein